MYKSPYRRKLIYARKSSISSRKSLNIKPEELYEVLRNYPELENKYIRMMKLPISGRNVIDLPFDFSSYHYHACLDITPYGNEKISKSVCIQCGNMNVPTASDALVAFMNQTSNVMQNRNYYYGFMKNSELIKMSTKQPSVFQIYYIVSATVSGTTPLMFSANDKLNMHIIFETKHIHLSSECMNQVLSTAHGYTILLDIRNDYVMLSVICNEIPKTNLHFDSLMLQRKLDDMEIPNDIIEKYENYKQVFPECF